LQKHAYLNASITLRRQKHCLQTLCKDCPTIISLRRRFHARTRRGTLCQSPTVQGKARCQLHGGAEGIGGQPGNRNAFRHGRYSAEAIAKRRMVAALIRACRDQLGAMGDV
jgi:hypothetical protein